MKRPSATFAGRPHLNCQFPEDTSEQSYFRLAFGTKIAAMNIADWEKKGYPFEK